MDITQKMLAFFDTDNWDEKYRIFQTMKEDMTDTILDNIAVSLDIVVPDGDIESRYENLRRTIQMKIRYEQQSERR